VLPSGASLEMATAAARTSTDETQLLVLCDSAVTGAAELSPGAAADRQLLCRLDLAAGSFVIHAASQPHLSGSLRRQGTAISDEQQPVASAASASQSGLLRQYLTALLLPQTGTVSATMPLSRQAEAHGWAAQLEASVAMDVITRPLPRSSYGFVPAIQGCAALAAPPPAPYRDQPFSLSVNAHGAARHGVRLQMFSILDCGGMQQLQAAGLAISSRREASSGGWLRPSSAPALATVWRPVAMPPESTLAKPAKWLIVSRRPTSLSAICTLPPSAVIQTENIVYDTHDGHPHGGSNTIFVHSENEAAAAMAASRADHIFCVCEAAPPAEDGLRAQVAAAAMLWAFRARARCSTPARMSLITFGQHIQGPDTANLKPACAAATGALAFMVVNNRRQTGRLSLHKCIRASVQPHAHGRRKESRVRLQRGVYIPIDIRIPVSEPESNTARCARQDWLGHCSWRTARPTGHL